MRLRLCSRPSDVSPAPWTKKSVPRGVGVGSVLPGACLGRRGAPVVMCARCPDQSRPVKPAPVFGRAGSAVEREPAQLVAQPLVVEHEVPDLIGELLALPLTLPA